MRVRIALLLAALGMLVMPATSLANFHLMSIREVFIDPTDSDEDYVVLQMYDDGQNFVGGHEVSVFRADGAELYTGTFDAKVDNGANQATILVSNKLVVDGISSDLVLTPLGQEPVTTGGAACFDAVDCVAWGNFTGHASLPPGSQVGVNAPAMVDGQALRRNISAGCGTLLEAGDDTDDSLADFALVAPNPRNNASPITETPCTDPDPDPDPDPDDTSPPEVDASGKGTQTPTGTKVAKLKGSCDEACDLEASGKVVIKDNAAASRKLKLKTAVGSLDDAGEQTLTLKLSKKNAKKLTKALANGAKATAKVKLTATDAAGNSASDRKSIRLKP